MRGQDRARVGAKDTGWGWDAQSEGSVVSEEAGEGRTKPSRDLGFCPTAEPCGSIGGF